MKWKLTWLLCHIKQPGFKTLKDGSVMMILCTITFSFLLIFDDKCVIWLTMELRVKLSFFPPQTSRYFTREPKSLKIQDDQKNLDVYCPASGQPGFPGHLWSHYAGQLHSSALWRSDGSTEVGDNTTIGVCFQIASAFSSSLFLSSFSIEPCKSSIYPFQELKRPLQFLGLYDTTLCNVTHIPAYKVPLMV